jgi:23S rRNA (cytidine1920-2'-O)/16S rRNA (cytidine1409-2'-O)-methyltransferase
MASRTHNDTARTRLDLLLTETGAFESRARARDAIARGGVRVNGQIVTKPGAQYNSDDVIEISDAARRYVSRAALKLICGLDHFNFDPAGCDALDIGASTGGFTQVLLERGAAHVTAIDVGHGQLHPSLVGNPRIDNHQGLNARNLSTNLTGKRQITALVSDVSFISLKLALPPALEIAASGCFCVLLVKPQFEAGRDAVGKGGIIRDPAVAQTVAEDMVHWLDEQPGWNSLGLCPSPIEGGDGNREYLLGGIKA